MLANLPHDRTNAEVVAALSDMAPAELLVRYINWQNRLISVSPREVLQSPTFAENPLVQARSTTVRKIVKDIERGDDLAKYLSRGIQVGFLLPRDPSKKELHRRRDLDLLLNDWGIHHRPLIFAAFKQRTAYLIDVMSHRDWTNEHLIQVIVRSWPNAGLVFELKGIIPSKQNWTAGERAQLRGAGLSTAVTIDSRSFMPSFGISTAGTSTQASLTAMRILRTLKQFEEKLNANPEEVVKFIRQHGGNVRGDTGFEFSFFNQGFGVIETTGGFPILLG